MKIQQKNGNIVISSGEVKAIVGDNLKVKGEDYDIVIGYNVEVSGNTNDMLIVDAPGEYEFKGLMVQALPAAGAREIQVFSIDFDGVNLVYLDYTSGLPDKRIIEQVGVNNILLLKLPANEDDIRPFVNAFEPNYLVPLVQQKSDYEQLAKKLGVILSEPEKALVISADDFDSDDEESALVLKVLE